MKKDNYKIAYLSMEIALENGIKTYAGGLGVLAGDILRSAADLETPMLGITLLNTQGYFRQEINSQGEQINKISDNYDFSKLRKLEEKVYIKIADDRVRINIWEYQIKGQTGFYVPVYLLDTDDVENKTQYRELTGKLYGGDKKYRLLQEIILGRGGIKMLQTLKYDVKKVHINEGHGAFAAIELFLEYKNESINRRINGVKEKCVFTTHTPIKTITDIFPLRLVLHYQKDFPKINEIIENKKVNMTKLALYFSHYINAVSLKHAEVSRKMFPKYDIKAITNGVHSVTWTSPEFQELFDQYISNWRISSLSLQKASIIPREKIWIAHQHAKHRLFEYVYKTTGKKLNKNIFTIAYAKRFTSYKRPKLLLSNMKRLLEINDKIGKIQIIYSGKAHPQDTKGLALIKEIQIIKEKYKDRVEIVFLKNYELNIAKLLVAGVDLWLNNPLPPLEASGTSGMKAAHNGIPQLSTLDGWWIEGYLSGKTGWAIGETKKRNIFGNINKKDAKSIYDLLEKEIIPMYYNHPDKWREIMRFCISINASFFNTERVVKQYIQEAYS